jgi:DNA replication initiation complex subunit (GINS family)
VFNIDTALSKLTAAETVLSSSILSDEDKSALLAAICDSLLADHHGIPEFAKIICASIKQSDPYVVRRDPGKPATQKQGRKAKGGKEPTEVASGPTKEGPEEAEGPTEGVQDEA